jgi:hypothetical protein
MKLPEHATTHHLQQKYLERNSVFMSGAGEREILPTRDIGKGQENAGMKKSQRRFAYSM